MSSIKPAIIFGNGPNRLSESSISWADVLDDIMRETPHLKASAYGKPFPLLFEEIAIHIKRQNRGDDGGLKRKIANKAGLLTPNSVHRQLLRLGIKNLLTTNYDYTLEKAAEAKGLSIVELETSEKKYSLFRKRTLADRINIWHVHGEVDVPRSLTLGYGHYTSYISNLHNYIIGNRSSQTTSHFLQGIAPGRQLATPTSWIDIFLKSNIFILGLGLGFEEIDLWWAITLKERMRNRFGKKIGKTVFYQFSTDGEVDIRCSSLLSLGVEVVLVEVDGEWDYHKGYFNILSDVKARCRFKKHQKYQKWIYRKKSSPTWLAK